MAWALRKDVASCDKPWVGACSLRSKGFRMGLPIVSREVDGAPLRWRGNPPNGSIQVGGGKETNRDSLISSERKGNSLN